MISETCRSLLVNSRRFSTTYGSGLFNHLPMALLALDRLGADEVRLRQFSASYEKRLRPKSLGELSLPGGDWREALSKRQYESALTAKFDAGLLERGKLALLGDIIPHLTSGLASEAFHGLIRVAYAVDSGDDADIAGALASWVTGFSELPGAPAAKRFTIASDAFNAIASDARLAGTIEGRSIVSRISKVNTLPAFDDYRSSIDNPALPALAKIAAQIFIATADFTALHLVTACHAVRILQPFLAPSALDVLATAMLTSYVAIGRPPISEPSVHDAPDPDTLAAQAAKSDDDHDLKLVYTCLREEAHYGGGLHRLAAGVRLGLLKPVVLFE
jgi:hypothetical protein